MTNDNTNIFTFDFRGLDIRAFKIDGEPWFRLSDVCDAMGLNAKEVARRVDAGDKQKLNARDYAFSKRLTPGTPLFNAVNETGLYSVILTSRKPVAKEFKRWVTHDVLPAIRKDGMYVQGEEKVAAGEMSLEEMTLKVLDGLKCLLIGCAEIGHPEAPAPTTNNACVTGICQRPASAPSWTPARLPLARRGADGKPHDAVGDVSAAVSGTWQNQLP